MDSWERFDEELLADKEAFTVVSIWKTLQLLIIDMQDEYIKNLIIKI